MKTNEIMESSYVKKTDLELLSTIENNSIDLVLTDPPYIISRKSGMQAYKDDLEKGGEVDKKYGTKYAITTEFGEWDKEFTIEKLQEFILFFWSSSSGMDFRCYFRKNYFWNGGRR